MTAVDAYAYELIKAPSGEVTRWASPDVAVSAATSSSPPGLAEATRAAFDTWTAVPASSFVAAWVGPDARDAEIRVRRDAGGEVNDALAITLSRYATASATITGVEIVLSAVAPLGAESTAYDLQSVIVHEAGHALGLGHTCGDRGGMYRSCFDLDALNPRARALVLGAIMAPSIAPQERRRAPNADDEAGLAALYPGPRGPAPLLGEVRRDCPSGDWVVAVQPADRVALRWRRPQDGTEIDATLRARGADTVVIEAPQAGWDLVAEDPLEGSRATHVALALDACPAPDGGVVGADVSPITEPDGGCSCGGPGRSRETPTLVLLLLLVANASALRRPS